MYELNSKVERADKLEQFVQFSALCKQCCRKYQPSKISKLLGSKKVNKPYILCKISTFFGTIRYIQLYIGLKFSEITEIVMLFQYSEVLFY